MYKKEKITIVGSGYVGMSLSVLMAQHNDVTILDIDTEKVAKINNKISPIIDEKIDLFFSKKLLSLTATTDNYSAYQSASYIIVATPTNFDNDTESFDTSSVDNVVEDALKLNPDALVVIKSTIPVGYTQLLQEKFNTTRIIFSPEFLREGHALEDNLYPSRIIVSNESNKSKKFADLLTRSAEKENIEVLLMKSTEAEAVKLFANNYLALRVAFFNELDSYSLNHNLSTKNIIDGVCLDQRIGDGYNNPSFGYGGYCLPKDTKQLLFNFKSTPQALIKAVISSNNYRKNFIADEIIKMNPKVIGIYRLIMKKGSHNFRSSAIQDIIKRIKKKAKKIEIILYEPELVNDNFLDLRVIKNIDSFKKESNIILCNRYSDCLNDVIEKCFTRDIYRNN